MSQHRRKPRVRDVYLFNGPRCVGTYRSVKAAAQAAREKNLEPDGITIVIPAAYRRRAEPVATINGHPVPVVGSVA